MNINNLITTTIYTEDVNGNATLFGEPIERLSNNVYYKQKNPDQQSNLWEKVRTGNPSAEATVTYEIYCESNLNHLHYPDRFIKGVKTEEEALAIVNSIKREKEYLYQLIFEQRKNRIKLLY
jgi:hypothetical protein